jgi:hypothetical protein
LKRDKTSNKTVDLSMGLLTKTIERTKKLQSTFSKRVKNKICIFVPFNLGVTPTLACGLWRQRRSDYQMGDFYDNLHSFYVLASSGPQV